MMKYLITILTLCLCSACATRKPVKIESSPGVACISRNDMPGVRIPETVKAYPVGRYTDPNFPDEMHERHTVYRREQSANWNFRPSEPYALLPGPTAMKSNPSPSYYAKTEGEMNAQQRAYAEALMEQNRAMKARIESMQQDATKVQGLEQEIDRLKKQLDSQPSPQPDKTPAKPEPAEVAPKEEDIFSNVEPPLPVDAGFTDPSDILLFANSDDESHAFLLSQMRLNDEFAAELESLERRRRESLFPAPLLLRKEFAFLTKNTP